MNESIIADRSQYMREPSVDDNVPGPEAAPRVGTVGQRGAIMAALALGALGLGGSAFDPAGFDMRPAGGESRRKQRRQHYRQPEGVTVRALPSNAPGPRPYRKDPVTGLKVRVTEDQQ